MSTPGPSHLSLTLAYCMRILGLCGCAAALTTAVSTPRATISAETVEAMEAFGAAFGVVAKAGDTLCERLNSQLGLLSVTFRCRHSRVRKFTQVSMTGQRVIQPQRSRCWQVSVCPRLHSRAPRQRPSARHFANVLASEYLRGLRWPGHPPCGYVSPHQYK